MPVRPAALDRNDFSLPKGGLSCCRGALDSSQPQQPKQPAHEPSGQQNRLPELRLPFDPVTAHKLQLWPIHRHRPDVEKPQTIGFWSLVMHAYSEGHAQHDTQPQHCKGALDC